MPFTARRACWPPTASGSMTARCAATPRRGRHALVHRRGDGQGGPRHGVLPVHRCHRRVHPARARSPASSGRRVAGPLLRRDGRRRPRLLRVPAQAPAPPCAAMFRASRTPSRPTPTSSTTPRRRQRPRPTTKAPEGRAAGRSCQRQAWEAAVIAKDAAAREALLRMDKLFDLEAQWRHLPPSQRHDRRQLVCFRSHRRTSAPGPRSSTRASRAPAAWSPPPSATPCGEAALRHFLYDGRHRDQSRVGGGAVACRAAARLCPPFPASCPCRERHHSVSDPRHIEPDRRVSRIRLAAVSSKLPRPSRPAPLSRDGGKRIP